MKKLCRDTKKVIGQSRDYKPTKKGAIRQVQIQKQKEVQKQSQSQAQRQAQIKTPRSGYHLFLREQFEKMTGVDRRNYCTILSRKWKAIKEDPARISAYNDGSRQIKDPSISSMEQQTMAERQLQKVPNPPEFVDTDSDDADTEDEEEQEPEVKQPKKYQQPQSLLIPSNDSDTEDEEEQKPAVKQPQKVRTSSEFVDTDSDTKYEEEQEPAPKQSQKDPKFARPVRMKSYHDKPMVKRIQTLPKKSASGKEPVLPLVKQLIP